MINNYKTQTPFGFNYPLCPFLLYLLCFAIPSQLNNLFPIKSLLGGVPNLKSTVTPLSFCYSPNKKLLHVHWHYIYNTLI